ncbi:GDSL-type esterase/lipase family protein [Pseudonocardia sp. TMWB2A]|uniref:GDSL-type esterase/lipase family protein n=1 Tax=Pseudonocardia sp. TMWB2A TaxID=687430 RepID=UPI00307E0CF4
MRRKLERAWRTRRARAGTIAAATTAVALLAAPLAMAGPNGFGSESGGHGSGGDGDWVTAWSASPQGSSTLGKFGAETVSGTNQAELLKQITPPITAFNDETVRQVMYLHQGGDAVRIRLSNQFGNQDVTFPTVTVGKRAGDSGADVEGAPVPVTFDGSDSVTIPEGGDVLSDPIPLETEALDHVVVSMFVPAGQGPATVHGNSMQTFFTTPGDKTAQTDDANFTENGIVPNRFTSSLTTAVYYATGIQVEGEEGDKTIVAFGDSITDGFLSDGNTDGRYPDALARRVQENPDTANLSITNQAISGGRVLSQGFGPSALDRFDKEVLEQPNIGGVIFLQGINDIGGAIFQDGLGTATADQLIPAYKELAARAHAKGVPFYIGTLTPAGNLLRPTPYGQYSLPQAVAERNKVNEWLRGEGSRYFDGVIDYDAAIRDPLVPDWIALQFDALDNLHPNQAGYEKMAESIPQEFLDQMANG